MSRRVLIMMVGLTLSCASVPREGPIDHTVQVETDFFNVVLPMGAGWELDADASRGQVRTTGRIMEGLGGEILVIRNWLESESAASPSSVAQDYQESELADMESQCSMSFWTPCRILGVERAEVEYGGKLYYRMDFIQRYDTEGIESAGSLHLHFPARFESDRTFIIVLFKTMRIAGGDENAVAEPYRRALLSGLEVKE